MLNRLDCLKDEHGESQFQRGWSRFEANKEGFPHGLKHTITNIRDQHPDLQHIAVWHAIVSRLRLKGATQDLFHHRQVTGEVSLHMGKLQRITRPWS